MSRSNQATVTTAVRPTIAHNRRRTDAVPPPPERPKLPESGFPPARRHRRSTEELLASAENPIKEAMYVSSRILSHSLRIKGYLQACSPSARKLVQAEFPELAAVIASLDAAEELDSLERKG
ncbi:MAG TPA: hypothetical protein VIY48_10985 [Candidatus Paceibacterota bacterium]